MIIKTKKTFAMLLGIFLVVVMMNSVLGEGSGIRKDPNPLKDTIYYDDPNPAHPLLTGKEIATNSKVNLKDHPDSMTEQQKKEFLEYQKPGVKFKGVKDVKVTKNEIEHGIKQKLDEIPDNVKEIEFTTDKGGNKVIKYTNSQGEITTDGAVTHTPKDLEKNVEAFNNRGCLYASPGITGYTPCGAGGGNALGDSAGAKGLESLSQAATNGIEQAFSAVLGFLGQIASIFGGVKDQVVAAHKESSAKVSGAYASKTELQTRDMGVALSDNNDNVEAIGAGDITLEGNENYVMGDNSRLLLRSGGIVTGPNADSTKVEDNSADGDASPPQTDQTTPFNPNQKVIGISLPLLKSFLNFISFIPFVNAEEILSEIEGSPSGQYVKFIGHDVEFNGRDIEVHALKTFNKLSAGGQDLDFYSGNIQIKFNQQRIYYPRLVKNAPFGVNKIQNKLDQNTEFKLQHYTNRKSKLTDNNERISVTDVTTKHPKQKLIISKIRKEMWK